MEWLNEIGANFEDEDEAPMMETKVLSIVRQEFFDTILIL